MLRGAGFVWGVVRAFPGGSGWFVLVGWGAWIRFRGWWGRPHPNPPPEGEGIFYWVGGAGLRGHFPG